ncbi:hypothetical protein B4096_2693 [Heyndrickxia coagulans]|uniref:Uncharacterized protein n=1 Tax=Heyndrickxia coagulans TaxID=1398 RepID=A0A0C5CAX2_HEYCO|nr:hypothetical protein SB48_HM08orf02801 [Heyndrickxia coagulans]KWZ84067.1 hypothetical protein HMPREF3213_01126 [Heyndrickxia coagulans]KYC61904.1 hypothetical protein B4100_3043 [Heyndrickxia coagulans]KYC91738.1 hypothetical protein B4096_2693 [Heyndrickxia coagulans]
MPESSFTIVSISFPLTCILLQIDPKVKMYFSSLLNILKVRENIVDSW